MTSRQWADDAHANVPMIPRSGGAEGDRTPDLLSAIQALSQLSYSPESRSDLNRSGRSKDE